MEKADLGQTPAERRAKAKLAFFNHAVVYLVVIGALAALNLLTNPHHLWFIWPLFGWGIAMLMHGLGVYVFSPDNRLYERLLEREKRHGT